MTTVVINQIANVNHEGLSSLLRYVTARVRDMAYPWFTVLIANILVVGDVYNLLWLYHNTTLKLVHRCVRRGGNRYCYSTIVYQTYGIDKHYYRALPLSMLISFRRIYLLSPLMIHIIRDDVHINDMMFSGCVVIVYIMMNQHTLVPIQLIFNTTPSIANDKKKSIW